MHGSLQSNFMNSILKPGIYKHYKGNLYEVVGVARHSETMEELVVYKALYENEFGKDSLWVRPLKMFIENVEIQGRQIPRFEYIKQGL